MFFGQALSPFEGRSRCIFIHREHIQLFFWSREGEEPPPLLLIFSTSLKLLKWFFQFGVEVEAAVSGEVVAVGQCRVAVWVLISAYGYLRHR